MAFTDSVLGGSDNDDFDPVAELEEQPRREIEKYAAENRGSDTDENNSGDTDDDK